MATVVIAGVAATAAIGTASARDVYQPVVPDPANGLWGGPNPTHDCAAGPAASPLFANGTGVLELDDCGAEMEGLAPLPLPANWQALSGPQRGFVLIELERIERAETPIVGISRVLDRDAASGAQDNTDPEGGASIWSSGDFVDNGMVGWMYDDGPGSYNLDCRGSDMSGCWGHRDNILEYPMDAHLAVGVAENASDSSAAAVFADGHSDLSFTWAQELAAGYPDGLPNRYALSPIQITSVSSERGGQVVITGPNLDTASAFSFSGRVDRAPDLTCHTQTVCALQIPSSLPGGVTYSMTATNAAGTSVPASATLTARGD